MRWPRPGETGEAWSWLEVYHLVLVHAPGNWRDAAVGTELVWVVSHIATFLEVVRGVAL
jgi:hypothetical protein